MAIFTKEFILHEKYVSKYAKYLDDYDDKMEDKEDDDDEEEDEDDDDEKSDSNKSKDTKSSSNVRNQSNNNSSSEEKKTPQHLSKEEIRRIMTIATSTLMDFPKLKKCCDYVDLNDDGVRESSFGKYYNSSAKAFIELMNGDIYSGYPDFKDKGSEAYEKDAHAFVKAVNEMLESRHIQAKFSIGSDKEDDAISFGVKSTKEK